MAEQIADAFADARRAADATAIPIAYAAPARTQWIGVAIVVELAGAIGCAAQAGQRLARLVVHEGVGGAALPRSAVGVRAANATAHALCADATRAFDTELAGLSGGEEAFATATVSIGDLGGLESMSATDFAARAVEIARAWSAAALFRR